MELINTVLCWASEHFSSAIGEGGDEGDEVAVRQLTRAMEVAQELCCSEAIDDAAYGAIARKFECFVPSEVWDGMCAEAKGKVMDKVFGAEFEDLDPDDLYQPTGGWVLPRSVNFYIHASIALIGFGTTAVQKEKAVGALWALSFNADNQVAIAKAGGIAPLIDLLKNGTTAKQKEFAAGALWYLAKNDDNKVAIADALDADVFERVMAQS